MKNLAKKITTYLSKWSYITSTVLVFSFLNTPQLFAQSQTNINQLAPKQAINIKSSSMPVMSATVVANLTGDLPETRACQKNSVAIGGLRIKLSWYNANDETGKMMLGMVSNKSEIDKKLMELKPPLAEIRAHYSTPGNGISCSQILEEDVPGGKLCMVEYSYARCDTDKPQQFTVNARCFFFNGNTLGEITIECQCKLDEVRDMVKSIIKSASEYNFSSTLSNT